MEFFLDGPGISHELHSLGTVESLLFFFFDERYLSLPLFGRWLHTITSSYEGVDG